MKERKKNQGGIHSRIGIPFSKNIEEIKDLRLINGKSKDRVSTEKISNLIIKHKLWNRIKEDIIEATQEEVDKHGNEE